MPLSPLALPFLAARRNLPLSRVRKRGACWFRLGLRGGVFALGTEPPARGAPQIIVDHGTVSPRFARDMSKTVRKGGGAFLDAPISGGPQGALEGVVVVVVVVVVVCVCVSCLMEDRQRDGQTKKRGVFV